MNKQIFSLLLASSFLLSACFSYYTVEVDLTPEEEGAIMEEVRDLKDELAATKKGEAPDHLDLIELARAYEKLGQIGRAAKTYEDYLADGHYAKAVIHNLGRLYESMDRYEDAIVQYQRIIDTYGDSGYLYDITKAHIKLKNRKEAEQYFNAWQLETQRTDTQIQQQIKQLRADEKAAQ